MTEPDLAALLHELFPDEDFDAADPGLGPGSFGAWDSLAHYNLLMLIEERYGVRFSMEELGELKSLGEIRGALAARGLG